MAENPRVNRYLHDKAIDHLDHALGRPVFPMQESARNYFATDIRSDEAITFGRSPHWELRNVTPDGMAFFSVTDDGRRALAAHLDALPSPWRAFLISYGGFSTVVPERTPGKAKYVHYLSIADCCPDLTFGQFAREARVNAIRRAKA